MPVAKSQIQPRLELKAISKRFGATQALDGVDLHVAPGEVHALIGENGAGKSTLMKVLSGAHQLDSGAMRLDGEAFSPDKPREAQEAGIAMIYQELNLAPDLSVAENITLGREPCRKGWVDRAAQNEIARKALVLLGQEKIPLDVPVGSISIAQQQMVEIARAMQDTEESSVSLRLLILDEPTSSLTQVDAENLFKMIDRLRIKGVSVLYISHFLEECQGVADRFTVLRDGRAVATGDIKAASLDEIARLMVGRSISELYPKYNHTQGETILKVEGLAGVQRPRGLSLNVRRGEIYGLAGLVGAGRTETARAIFGLDRMTEGKVWIQGKASGNRSPECCWQAEGMGLVPEDRKTHGLLAQRSLIDNLALTRLASYRQGLFLNLKRMRQATQQWIERLGVKASDAAQNIDELSGGNQQKIVFGRLLHHDCDILLLDEPARGIDIGSKATLYQFIGELAAKGKAILLISSYLPELLGVCDTIGVVSRGRLVASKPRSQWDEHSLLLAAIDES